MRRKIALAGLLAAAVLSASACSGGGSGAGGSTSGEIVVAVPLPLTGGNVATAEIMKNSAQLAVDEINNSGGAGGRKLVVKVYDDKGTGDQAATVTQRALTEDGAQAVIGTYSGLEGLAVRAVTERQSIPLILTSTISPEATQGATYTFRTSGIQQDYIPAFLGIVKGLNAKNVSILRDDGVYGMSMTPLAQTAFAAAGLNVSPPVGYLSNAADLSSQVATLVSQRPDTVVLFTSQGADMGLAIKTMVEQGLNVPVMSSSGIAQADTQRIAGPAYNQLPGVYTLANKDPSKAAFNDFIAAYRKAYGGPDDLATTIPEQASQTYDAFKIYAAALSSTKGDTSGAAVAKAIHGITGYQAVSGKSGITLSFGNGQDGLRNSLTAFRVVNGKSEVAPGLS